MIAFRSLGFVVVDLRALLCGFQIKEAQTVPTFGNY